MPGAGRKVIERVGKRREPEASVSASVGLLRLRRFAGRLGRARVCITDQTIGYLDHVIACVES